MNNLWRLLPLLPAILIMGCGHGGVDPTAMDSARPQFEAPAPGEGQGPGLGGDQFDSIVENDFVNVVDQPLSTFSIDVDTASYSKTRMYLREGSLPPRGAVRIEEFVNYFDYQYSPPTGDLPFAVHVESSAAPWQAEHRLVRVALQGRDVDRERVRSNLVFLVDVSGSMDTRNKLPLVKQGLKDLSDRLTENDRVSIVVYAGAAGLVLPPTSGDQRQQIQRALKQLHAGGSTNGGQGIELAYRVARENFIPGGVNRVILCSDGDFNVGTTNRADLVQVAEENAAQGVYLTVLGFGMGNHNDAMMEEISNKADGNYAFIDTELEARKVLGDQLSGTLVTIAKDVKIQIEFNPLRVASYRLIGYENRILEAQDFNDDRKDAGEVGAGHAVTALYELTLSGDDDGAPQIDPLRYQTDRQLSTAAASTELLTLKVRYKRPHEEQSELIEHRVADQVIPFQAATRDFQFAAAVASFGMLLRNSKYRGNSSYDAVSEIARSAKGQDAHGYRAEFLELVNTARKLSQAEG